MLNTNIGEQLYGSRTYNVNVNLICGYGKSEIILVSKDFFEQMEVKPEYRDCIPMCCRVMKNNIKEDVDEVLYHTPSCQSHTLKIKYKLPR